MKTLTTFLATLFLIASASANEAFIKDVSVIGNGCSEDDSMAILSPDQKTLSLLFENFVIDSSSEGRSPVIRKSCNMKVEIAVPHNKRIAISKIDYRGYAYLPYNSSLRFMSGHYLQVPSLGIVGRSYRTQEVINGSFDDDLYFEQYVNDTVADEACGEDVTLNVDTKLFINMNHEDIYASIDSLDSGIQFHVEFEDCYKQPARPTRRPRVNNTRRPRRSTTRQTRNRGTSRRYVIPNSRISR